MCIRDRTYPVIENGHEVRLVGTPLDREVIDELRKSNFHINLKRTLPDTVKYYQAEEVEEALKGADVVLCGVSSFGVDWFAENILPIIPDDVPMIAVTKGMIDQEEDVYKRQPYRRPAHPRQTARCTRSSPWPRCPRAPCRQWAHKRPRQCLSLIHI